jgi:hypothetical protein
MLLSCYVKLSQTDGGAEGRGGEYVSHWRSPKVAKGRRSLTDFPEKSERGLHLLAINRRLGVTTCVTIKARYQAIPVTAASKSESTLSDMPRFLSHEGPYCTTCSLQRTVQLRTFVILVSFRAMEQVAV